MVRVAKAAWLAKQSFVRYVGITSPVVHAGAMFVNVESTQAASLSIASHRTGTMPNRQGGARCAKIVSSACLRQFYRLLLPFRRHWLSWRGITEVTTDMELSML